MTLAVGNRRHRYAAAEAGNRKFTRSEIPEDKKFKLRTAQIRLRKEGLFIITYYWTKDEINAYRKGTGFWRIWSISKSKKTLIRRPIIKNRGIKNPKAKLTEDEVIAIRKEYGESFVTQQELADKYNVAVKTVNYIINRKLWTHIK